MSQKLPHAHVELKELLDQAMDRELTAAGQTRLNELLASDPSALDFYIAYVQLHGQLAWDFADTEEADDSATSADKPVAAHAAKHRCDAKDASLPLQIYCFFARPTPFSMTVATVVVGLILTAMAFMAAPIYRTWSRSNEDVPGRPSYAVVAEVTHTHLAVWRTGELAAYDGAHLVAGRKLELEAGLIEVKMRSGARLVVEAPVKMELNDANRVTLNDGKVVALVPESAVGFTVSTPVGEFVDLGTEFGVATSSGDETTAEVFAGKIEVRPRDSSLARHTLTKGQRLTLRASGALEAAAGEEFVRYVPGSDNAPVELVAFFPFDGNAQDASGNGHHATKVANITFVDGRDGSAARFAGVDGSYIDLPVDARPESLPVMTWGAWIRPAVVEMPRRTIVSTDIRGFNRSLQIDNRRGVRESNVLRLSAYCGKLGVLPSSGPIPAAREWRFVAAVYEGTQDVDLYVEDPLLNDRRGGLVVDSSQPLGFKPGDDFDRLSAGSTFTRLGMHAGGNPIPFDGEIDNFFVFRGALKREQLEAIRENGANAIRELANANR